MRSLILSLIITIFTVSVQSQKTDNALTPEEFATGWQLLFDGESLNGWKAYNGDKPQSWSVSENSIFCDPENGSDDIITVECFGDFDLKFEWKIQVEGNSGVIYLSREGKQWRKPYLTGLEYQVAGEINKFDNHSVGAVYDVYAPSKDKKVFPSMQWNTGRIRLSNGLITHWVNGSIVLQCELNSVDWNERVAGSKWKERLYYGKSPFGHIDFQNHGSKVWYKNVKILKLSVS